MNTLETNEESCFEKKDEKVIENLKRKDKKEIIIFSIIALCLIIIGPFISSRSSNIRFIDQMSYLEAAMRVSGIMIVLSIIPLTFYLTHSFKDYRMGKKIIVRTKIKKIIMKDSVRVEFIVTSPYFKSKSIKVKNEQSYLGISANDNIMISFLPKSKIVLDLKRV